MSLTISFYLLMSLSTLTARPSTETTVDEAKYEMTVRKYLSRSAFPTENLRMCENLRIIVNYVHGAQAIHPSIFSLVSSDGRSSFVDVLSKYVASESIVSYKITTTDFSRKYTWQSRIDLTWVFIVDGMNILNSFVHEQSHIWKAPNQYLVIDTAPNATRPGEVFEKVWKLYGVYRIVIISLEDDFRCLSRYLPFEKNRQNEYGVVRKVCLTGLTGRRDNVELYANFENLNGYPVRVVVFPSLMMRVDEAASSTGNPRFSGLDADVMLLLERAMGAWFRVNVFSVVNSTNGDAGDPFHHTLQYIESGESEMIITSFFVQEYRRYKEYRKYEFTAGIYEDKLCLIAPTAGFVPKSYMPVMSFAPDLWLALAVYNVLVSVLWFLVTYYSVSFRRRQAVLLPLASTRSSSRRSDLSPPRIHPYVLSCFDLVEASCYPLKEKAGGGTTAQRALLIGTLFFGLIVTGLYQSCLMSSLSDPFHYPELNTLEDVAASNFTIITKYYNLKENTFTGNTTLDNKLRSKLQVFVSKERTYAAVAFGRRTIAISRYASVKLSDMSRYYDVDGNELLHIVEEYPTTYLLSYVTRLHSPYQERVNGLLLRMQEAGLVYLWYERMVYPWRVVEQRRRVAKSERKIKLTMDHYSLTFVGLTLGLFSCTLVFLAELYFARISSRSS
ncbi:PREDICTED: uncharacterized protein LOC105557692 [Vollenhovia emeryi]|uniref:uncharacterized protein LOC105557692 n=1 Tax=Vollenhovia emeryi TaxID=411798 RepID=UPI0005F39164|nr:PREDICTED: uncharacterized protein LOC105557692 [Vollenhovia emeryi]